jgi:hypothetical protein
MKCLSAATMGDARITRQPAPIRRPRGIGVSVRSTSSGYWQGAVFFVVHARTPIAPYVPAGSKTWIGISTFPSRSGPAKV